MHYRGLLMISSLIFSHGPGLSFGAGDRNLARESASRSESILGGNPGHKMGDIKC